MAELNARQQRFCIEYVRCGNATEAALIAGYNEKTARKQGSRLLTKVDIQNEISRLAEPEKKERIASKDEVLEFLTAVVRGDIKEKVVTIEGIEYEREPSVKDKTRAAELLGKRYAIFRDKVEVDSEVTGVVMLPEVEEETRG